MPNVPLILGRAVTVTRGAVTLRAYGATAASRSPGTTGASCASARGLWVRGGGSVKGAPYRLPAHPCRPDHLTPRGAILPPTG